MNCDVVSLAQKLISFNTISQEGREGPCLDHIDKLLSSVGFTVYHSPLDECRGSLVARLHPNAKSSSLCLAGHIDTVPLGAEPWTVSPFEGDIRDGMLYGRGSVDMKGGIAAMIAAAIELAPLISPEKDLVIHCYGAEETGCEGSFDVTKNPKHTEGIKAAIVAEPTSNQILIGHKGALWLKGTAKGKTAHGSMPHEGDNALIKAVNAVISIEEMDIQCKDPHMGAFSKIVSTFKSGLNINSVPDNATFTIDMRTVPGQKSDELLLSLQQAAGDLVELETLLNVPPFWTDPKDPWVARTSDILQRDSEKPKPYQIQTVQFFTDAAALRQVLPTIPIIILGPGDPGKAHSTDEACPVIELQEAFELYREIIKDWYEIGA